MVGTRLKRGRKAQPIVLIDGVSAKLCTRCGIMQPLTNYGTRGKLGLHAQCRSCFTLTGRESRARMKNGTTRKNGPSKRRKERFIDGKRQKFCKGCDSWLYEAAFPRSKAKYDGLHAYCLACNRTKQAAERARRGEGYREMRRRYRRTDRGARAYSKYKPTHPWQHEAQKKIWLEIQAGRLVKPKTCSECDRGGRIDGHHDDYAKPLVVRWLCRWCHQKWHRIHGEALNANSATG